MTSNFVTSTDIDYVDDLTQSADTITNAQTLLHRQEMQPKTLGFMLMLQSTRHHTNDFE